MQWRIFTGCPPRAISRSVDAACPEVTPYQDRDDRAAARKGAIEAKRK